MLEYRHCSSDDEMLSIDDMDSTGTDDMEDGQEELMDSTGWYCQLIGQIY